MAKFKKKRPKGAAKARGDAGEKEEPEAVKHISSLLNLHRLQGVLLKKLQKEIC